MYDYEHIYLQGGTATRIGLVAFVLVSVLDYKEAALKAGMDVSAQVLTFFTYCLFSVFGMVSKIVDYFV